MYLSYFREGMAEDSSALTPVKNIVDDPNSNGDVENLLDVVAALVWDCNFQSAKNSRAIQSFVQRYDLCNMYQVDYFSINK